MDEFSNSLNGFGKFKEEMSDATLFNMMKKARPNAIAENGGSPLEKKPNPLGIEIEQEAGLGDQSRERGLNLKGYHEDTPIGKMNADWKALGNDKGMNAGGPDFVPNATKAQTIAKATTPTGGNPTGYDSNDGVMKKVSDNVTNNVFRGNEQNFGSGFNNQRSFGKQPDYGQTDLSHVESMKRQKQINTMPIKANTKTIGGKVKGIFQDSKKHVGRGIVTAELFGKVGDSN